MIHNIFFVICISGYHYGGASSRGMFVAWVSLDRIDVAAGRENWGLKS